MNMVTSKAAAKPELLLNELASEAKQTIKQYFSTTGAKSFDSCILVKCISHPKVVVVESLGF
jgi:hypothetical protein